MSERVPSPAPTASSLDAQIAGLAGYHDASAYNTDYEEGGGGGGAETDGDMDVVEMDPIEEAVAYAYGLPRR